MTQFGVDLTSMSRTGDSDRHAGERCSCHLIRQIRDVAVFDVDTCEQGAVNGSLFDKSPSGDLGAERQRRRSEGDARGRKCAIVLAHFRNPSLSATQLGSGSVPDTWVTGYSGDMGNTFGPKGLFEARERVLIQGCMKRVIPFALRR